MFVKYNILYKAVTIALVCLFSVNSVALADSDTLATLAGNPKVYQEMRDIMQERFVAHQEPVDSIIERLARDNNAKEIFNTSSLVELKNEFLACYDIRDNNTLARLRETLKSSGGQIQIIFVKNEKDLPKLEGDMAWGHAGKYVTVFAVEGEEKSKEGRGIQQHSHMLSNKVRAS